MSSTQNVIGFVKYPPGDFQEVNWLGGKFRVWPQQVAIVDILRRGRHEARIFGPGIHSIDKVWFVEQKTLLTILSTGEEHFDLSETFAHEVHLPEASNPRVSVSVRATIRFRLISREDELKAALDRLLERDPEKLGKLDEILQQYTRDAFREVIRRAHLLLLQQVPRHIEQSVKSYLDTDARARQELAIEIVAVQIDSMNLSPLPAAPVPIAPFILYRGPLDLAPNCRLVNAGGLLPELRIEVKRDQIALIQGERLPAILPGLHDLRQASLNDPQHEVILLSLARYELSFLAEFSRYFEFEDGTRGEHSASAEVTLLYQISPRQYGAITFDTADNLLGFLRREAEQACRELMRIAPDRFLQRNIAELGDYLLSGLREYKRIEENGVQVIKAHITKINLPPGVKTIGIEPAQEKLLTKTRLGALIDPSSNRLQIPGGFVAIYSMDDTPKALKAGSHQLSVKFDRLDQLDSNLEIKLINTDEIPLEIEHTFSPTIPLPQGLVQLPISLTATIYYQADISDLEDPDVLDALERISPSEERRQKTIETKARSAIEIACLQEGIALLNKNVHALNAVITQELNHDLYGTGLKLSKVAISNIELPAELYEAVMAMHRSHILWLELIAEERRNLLSSLADTDRQRRYAEMIPSLSLPLLGKNDPQALRELMNNAAQVASVGIERNEGEQVVKALDGLFRVLKDDSSLPPPTGPVPTTIDEAESVVGTYASEADNLIENIQKIDSPSPPQYLESPIHLGSGSKPREFPASLLSDIERCRQTPGVKIPAPKEDTVTIIFNCTDGPIQRLRLVLKDFEDYPEVEPVVIECRSTNVEGEEQTSKPALDSLIGWHQGSNLEDIVREVIQRNCEIG